MRLGEAVVHLQGLQRHGLRLGQVLHRRLGAEPDAEQLVGIGQTGIRDRVAGILRDGLLEVLDGLLDVRPGPLVRVKAAEEIQVVRVGVAGRLLLDPLLLLRETGPGTAPR